MQQVFRAVNRWLTRDDVTRARRLRLQPYKIVPLSPQAGVLEWCVDTTPLSVWLVGSGGSRSPPGAHARYRPADLPHREARKLMADAAALNKTEELHRQYEVVTQKTQPVMRFVGSFPLVLFYKLILNLTFLSSHFFTERFLEPATWFERRLAYTRSVASSSIVGFVLGLGDRHPSNILINEKTAEVVHIDLGVAFDQVCKYDLLRTFY
jgi:ataxia telangiectasia mutated family protein